MIDTSTELGARAERRLREEKTGWLTTVNAKGGPQPAPVWFLYERDTAADVERIVVYSYNKAKRLEHLPANPRVAFNLNTNAGGGDVIVLLGTGRIAPDLPAPLHNKPFLDKYMPMIENEPTLGTPEQFAKDYGIALEITNLRLWGF